MIFYIVATCIMFALIGIVFSGLLKSYLSKKDDKKMYYFIRNFKNGPIFYVYILVFLVFLIGILEKNLGAHQDTLYDIFISIADSLIMTVEAIVFKYQLDNVKGLMDELFIYRLLVFVIFIASFCSSFLFVFSFFGKNMYNNKRLNKALEQDSLYIIIGFNKHNYKLLDESKNTVFIDCVAQDELDSKVRKSKIDGIKEELYLSNITFKIFDDYTDIPRFINELSKKNYKDLRIIINTEDENVNVNLINEFYKNDTNNAPGLNFDKLNNLNYYVFGSNKYSSLYSNIIEKSKGRFHFINVHKMLADSFEYNYPLTRFMDENHLDYKTGTLKNDTDVNVFMIGFGRVNKEIFMNSVRNNQFITLENYNANDKDMSKVIEKHKPVNYYIFEKEKNNNIEQNLNFTYFRFENEHPKPGFENDYYDEIHAPANIKNVKELIKDSNITNVDVESKEFYKLIENAIEASKSFNYIIVSCGEDLFNIDIAKKIKQKASEWDLFDGSQVKIFVRVKDDYLASIVKLENNENEYEIIPFGVQSEVLNLNNIVNLKLESLALRRHIKYTESQYKGNKNKINDKFEEIKSTDVYKNIDVPENEIEQIEMIALFDWFYKWNQNKRESNIYTSLNIRFKLNLLGYDIDETNEFDLEKFNKIVQDFNNVYGQAKGYELNDLDVKGARRNLAIQEHYRWNAYMVCNGYLPARVSVIDKLYEKYGKSYKDILAKKRFHANITTLTGLENFMIHITYLKNNNTFSKEDLVKALNNTLDAETRKKLCEISKNEDVFRWDFEFMDKIIEELTRIEMGLIKKGK